MKTFIKIQTIRRLIALPLLLLAPTHTPAFAQTTPPTPTIEWLLGIESVTINLIIISLPIFIAMCALMFAIYNGIAQQKHNRNSMKAQRKHNRLSVKPWLSAVNSLTLVENTWKWTCVVTNNGSGPAFIKKFQIYYEGNPMSRKDAAEKSMGDLMGDKSFFETAERDIALKPGDSINFADVNFVEPNLESNMSYRKLINERIDTLDLRIEYISLYGEEHCFDTRANKQKLQFLT